ncbi:ribonuclease H-like YkuK family protein [Anaerobacillus isosaccharinicus]|uniref:Ribonuclease H-like YkuK family protein n=1 Tax=Anaerobacillus isosaccharinicus TaxID=1532552 RepID=A0A1S2LHY5_9BACI|nr:ribonuclease H-like YkuK family protein [Anaerobacillus isosaccharinicus]MBA5586911.1 ribonuclease H-like YkuK family protein [Anaerobacillus isosaccharinicus]QOY34881.1 ribonuclease H-like YkuK family protein [Anaerobacillus isosaccharinicus]
MDNDLLFYNTTADEMTFEDVFTHLVQFIKSDPQNFYRMAIGTDSQVHPHGTKFITSIHLHRIGKGVWGCLKKEIIPRRITSLKEKIYLETMYSQEVAAQFTEDHITRLIELLIPHADHGADLAFEVHLDIGKKGKTKYLIDEMTEQILAIGLQPKIKPNSYAASSYANKYTK